MQRSQSEPLPPPTLERGPIGWLRQNLFSSIPNTILTLIVLYLLYLIVPPTLRFLVIDAVWTGADRAACREDMVGRPVGACWAFVWDRLGYFTYGGSTPLGPYLTIVRPEMWLSDTLARQRAALRGMSTIVERPRGGPPRAAARGGVPSTATGTGGVFMDYSHFYPTPEPYGRR